MPVISSDYDFIEQCGVDRTHPVDLIEPEPDPILEHDAASALRQFLKWLTEPQKRIYRNIDSRLIGWCCRMVLSDCPYSEVQIAGMFGISKAHVSKLKVLIQEDFGMTPRIGRSDDARRKFSQICKSRPKKQRTGWTGAASIRTSLLQNS